MYNFGLSAGDVFLSTIGLIYILFICGNTGFTIVQQVLSCFCSIVKIFPQIGNRKML